MPEAPAARERGSRAVAAVRDGDRLRRVTTSRRPVSGRLFAHDRSLGVARVAGADEAGRGCLAGPLVAAAVCLDLGRMSRSARLLLTDLDDSKRLAPDTRQRLAAAILRVADQVVVVSAAATVIDRDGLHVTNLRLLGDALRGLEPAPEVCLVDGFHLGPAAPPHRRIVGGDRRSACIAAASVVAKATRDRLMAGPVADRYPLFGFPAHVGYATPAHRDAIRAHGPTPLHRLSFASAAFADHRVLTP
ncbi:MAG: ribonuclease HII [Thermoleophilia bacterium]